MCPSLENKLCDHPSQNRRLGRSGVYRRAEEEPTGKLRDERGVETPRGVLFNRCQWETNDQNNHCVKYLTTVRSCKDLHITVHWDKKGMDVVTRRTGRWEAVVGLKIKWEVTK